MRTVRGERHGGAATRGRGHVRREGSVGREGKGSRNLKGLYNIYRPAGKVYNMMAVFGNVSSTIYEGRDAANSDTPTAKYIYIQAAAARFAAPNSRPETKQRTDRCGQ